MSRTTWGAIFVLASGLLYTVGDVTPNPFPRAFLYAGLGLLLIDSVIWFGNAYRNWDEATRTNTNEDVAE